MASIYRPVRIYIRDQLWDTALIHIVLISLLTRSVHTLIKSARIYVNRDENKFIGQTFSVVINYEVKPTDSKDRNPRLIRYISFVFSANFVTEVLREYFLPGEQEMWE